MKTKRTYKQAVEFAGCSLSTLKRWQCWFCEQPMLNVARGTCGAIGDRCDTDARTKAFGERHSSKEKGADRVP